MHQIIKPTESYTKKKINNSSIYSNNDQSEGEDSIGIIIIIIIRGTKLCKSFLGRTRNERDNLTDLSVYGKILKFIPYKLDSTDKDQTASMVESFVTH